MPKQIILEFPCEVPEEVINDPEILKESKTAAVLNMLRKGAITQDYALQLLEIDREILVDLMAKFNGSGSDRKHTPEDPTDATAGAWDKQLDCETFEQEIYASRLQNTRPEVRM